MAIVDPHVADPLDEASLPSLFRAADQASNRGQRRAANWGAARLALLFAAAVAGVVPLQVGRLDMMAFVAMLAFVLALLLEVRLATDKPERTWYQGRAAAESVKTLSWKYAVGGSPFGVGPDDPDGPSADRLFLDRLTEVKDRTRDLDWAPVNGSGQITGRMRALRAQPLAARRAVYASGRVEDQRRWYVAKARANEVAGDRWANLAYGITALGVVGAALKGAGVVGVDVLGVASAAAAAAVAWIQFRQYRTLRAAYALTAQELGVVADRLATVTGERAWAEAVGDAEQAISREHTLWLARRDAIT